MKIIPSRFYNKWFDKLDNVVQIVILTHLNKLSKGALGNNKHLKGGVYELKIDFQKGYRIYNIKAGENIILLLCAGIKDEQTKDINRAIKIKEFYEKGGNIL
ncbi:MAG: type II toxin-antitoxin system RelE/ParE family toxin [Endomicrobium sp.]|jgi:putative addiction module killer protein|nr:type II toxin-antitoxin system RelE/ParE family toxin [Endomicrobium sp.]